MVICLTICCLSTAIWAVLAVPETAMAKKPDRGGGGGPGDQPANFMFISEPGNAVDSDGGGEYIDGVGGANIFIGRRDGQFAVDKTSKQMSSGRMVCVDSSWIVGFPTDPDCDFSGCRVAHMLSLRIAPDNTEYLDFGTMTEETGPVEVRFLIRLFEDRQNVWDLLYQGVLVTPGGFDSNGNPTTWDIGTMPPGTDSVVSPTAKVTRVKDNKWSTGRIQCGELNVPFHLRVTLQ